LHLIIRRWVGPSIDPELMIRMLVVGYVFAIRSERLICREVNLAYRWFWKLGIEDAIPDIRHFRALATSASARCFPSCVRMGCRGVRCARQN
jgi:transposase